MWTKHTIWWVLTNAYTYGTMTTIRIKIFYVIPRCSPVALPVNPFFHPWLPDLFSIFRYIDFKGDLWLWGMGSCDYKGWEVPWSATCKLEIQKTIAVIQSESEGLSTRLADGVNPTQRDENVRGPPGSISKAELKNGWILPTSNFCSSQTLKELDDAHIGEANLLSPST